MAIPDQELINRYRSGATLAELAEETGVSASQVTRRLRGLGVPARRSPSRTVNDDQIRRALNENASISAAARVLGIPRDRLIADAQRLGLKERPKIPEGLTDAYQAGQSIEQLAELHHVGAPTISRWLRSLGVTIRPAVRRRREP